MKHTELATLPSTSGRSLLLLLPQELRHRIGDCQTTSSRSPSRDTISQSSVLVLVLALYLCLFPCPVAAESMRPSYLLTHHIADSYENVEASQSRRLNYNHVPKWLSHDWKQLHDYSSAAPSKQHFQFGPSRMTPQFSDVFAMTNPVEVSPMGKRDGKVRRCGRVLLKHLQSVCGGCLKSPPHSQPVEMEKRTDLHAGGDLAWRAPNQKSSWALAKRNATLEKRSVSKITEICCTQRACSDDEIRPFCC